MSDSGIPQSLVQRLIDAEMKTFVDARPRSMALTERARSSQPRGVPMSWMDDLYDHPPLWIDHGKGVRFTDVDGYEYIDFYVADHSAFCGHASEPIVEAVSEQMARGNQFLMPGEDAITVSEDLATRYGLPLGKCSARRPSRVWAALAASRCRSNSRASRTSSNWRNPPRNWRPRRATW